MIFINHQKTAKAATDHLTGQIVPGKGWYYPCPNVNFGRAASVTTGHQPEGDDKAL